MKGIQCVLFFDFCSIGNYVIAQCMATVLAPCGMQLFLPATLMTSVYFMMVVV